MKSGKAVDGGEQKAVVFEKAKHQKIDHHGADHGDLCAGMPLFFLIGSKLQSGKIVKDHRKRHQQQIGRVAPCIEYKGAQKHGHITEPFGHHIAQDQADGKEGKQKHNGVECH